MMAHVIYSHGLAGIAIAGSGDGKGFVEKYDPNAYNGRGVAEFTRDPARALRFSSAQAALAFIMQVPRKRPKREDGRPNRPIRAFHLEIQQEAKDGSK